MKPIISKNLTPCPLPYKGRGFSKPLSLQGRGLQEGSIYTLKTFQTSSKFYFFLLSPKNKQK
jgi:hypothetical protein